MATPTFPGAWSWYDEYLRVDRQQSRWALKNRRYCPWTRNQTCTSASGDTTRRGFGRRHNRPTLAPGRTQLERRFGQPADYPQEVGGMTTLGPPDPADWATTGVDLETRRVRILWGLATLGRTAEQRQFQSRYQAFMKIDEALADGYAQARYQHIIISLTTPGGAKRSGARDRRRDPQAFHQRTSTEVHPSPNRIQTDDNTGDKFETAADPLQMPLRRQVAEVLERAMRDPAPPTLPTEILLERRLAALRSKGGSAPGGT